MTSFLGVPIRRGDEALGNIYLPEKLGEAEFSQDDEDLLVHFAGQAAIAIRNARRFQSEQESRLEAEAVRNRLETLVNTSPVGVLVADAASGDVVLVNREAERLLGISDRPDDIKSALDSATVFRQQDGREMEPEEQALQRTLYQGENSRALEMRLHLPDGRTIPTLVNASPIQDLTPIEEIERLRSEFLGMGSHEFRTPLTAIKGSAATVLGSRTPFDAYETREFFQIIDEQADRLRDLVIDDLDITRIEAGVLSVSPESTEEHRPGEASLRRRRARLFRQEGCRLSRWTLPRTFPR
jgi:K+-sensing histidine kinase KdpD